MTFLLDNTGKKDEVCLEVWRTLARGQAKVGSAFRNPIHDNDRLACRQARHGVVKEKSMLLPRILLSTPTEMCAAQILIPPVSSKDNIKALEGLYQQMLTSLPSRLC